MPVVPARIGKALLAGAFVLALGTPAHARGCASERFDLEAGVDHVFDGDTIRLEDGRRVRFIGINTPEHGRDGAPDEPFAAAATAALRNLIRDGGGTVALRLGAERRDRHGRLLAHAHLADGRSIARILLRRGLALQITVPPNTRNRRCYRAAERAARTAGRGVWSHPRYRGVAARRLPGNAAGFRVVHGRVGRVGESRRAWWLELDGLTLRLDKDDLAYFEGLEPERLLQRRLRVRGWIYRVRGEARMNLRHPDALELPESQ